MDRGAKTTLHYIIIANAMNVTEPQSFLQSKTRYFHSIIHKARHINDDCQ